MVLLNEAVLPETKSSASMLLLDVVLLFDVLQLFDVVLLFDVELSSVVISALSVLRSSSTDSIASVAGTSSYVVLSSA